MTLYFAYGSNMQRAAMRRRATGRPRPGYVQTIATAAREWKLPERYIMSVECVSTSR